MPRTGFFLDLGDFRPILELVRCEKPATRKGSRQEKRNSKALKSERNTSPRRSEKEQNPE
ncbi:hypothetical protein CH371_04540 [Leptospira wolffii]|uniref:Uncharacterized protein n=1 Tax=Leptospira wolffii TaxID=409998 RepID=A0A2M9ZFZ0_9LEPT|nr:hypothetical protein CH371_04540 [Leptospira wolffii]